MRKSAANALEDARALSEVQCRDLFRDIREGFFVGELIRDSSGRAIDFLFLEINAAFTCQTGLSVEAAVRTRATEAKPRFTPQVI